MKRSNVGAGTREPVKAGRAALRRGMSVNAAFQAVMLAGIEHLRANERGFLAGREPEYVHQMRVALRRLRSAVEIFGPLFPLPAVARAGSGVRWLAAGLGPARDWDVFVTETLPAIEKEFGALGEIKDFSERCRELRNDAGARARRAVRSARYRRLMRSLGALAAGVGRLRLAPDPRAALDAPVGAFAGKVLEKRYNQVRKRGRNLDGLSARQLHRLRIAVKKFRYAADFFAGLYEGAPVREALRRLSRLQDRLGAINDAATVASLVACGLDGTGDRNFPAAKGILLGWSHDRAETLRGELKGAWTPFRTAGRFWR